MLASNFTSYAELHTCSNAWISLTSTGCVIGSRTSNVEDVDCMVSFQNLFDEEWWSGIMYVYHLMDITYKRSLGNLFTGQKGIDQFRTLRGNRASSLTVSSSMPTKERTVEGPMVFSGAMGMPTNEQNCKNIWSWLWQRSNVCASKKKSSNIWMIDGIFSLVLAIHSIEVLKASNV